MAPMSLENGRRPPRKLLRAVVARLLGRKGRSERLRRAAAGYWERRSARVVALGAPGTQSVATAPIRAEFGRRLLFPHLRHLFVKLALFSLSLAEKTGVGRPGARSKKAKAEILRGVGGHACDNMLLRRSQALRGETLASPVESVERRAPLVPTTRKAPRPVERLRSARSLTLRHRAEETASSRCSSRWSPPSVSP